MSKCITAKMRLLNYTLRLFSEEPSSFFSPLSVNDIFICLKYVKGPFKADSCSLSHTLKDKTTEKRKLQKA